MTPPVAVSMLRAGSSGPRPSRSLCGVDAALDFWSEEYQTILDTRGHLQHDPARQLLKQRGEGAYLSTCGAVRYGASCGNDSTAAAKPRVELFDRIEVFNSQRRHSRLDQISPAAFECRASKAV